MVDDPLMKQLKGQRYLGVKVPRTGLNPLEILVKDWNSYDYISTELKSIFRKKNECNLPPLKTFYIPHMSGEIDSNVKVGFGISFFKQLLNLMGLPNTNIESSFKKIAKINYSFKNVFGNEVELYPLDQYLNCSDSIIPAPTLKIDLEKDRVCIITSVLYSNAISIDAYDEKGFSIDIEKPLMKGLSNADVEFSLESKESGKIFIENKERNFAFCLKAARLFYKDGKYSRYKLVDSGSVKARVMLSADPSFGGGFIENSQKENDFIEESDENYFESSSDVKVNIRDLTNSYPHKPFVEKPKYVVNWLIPEDNITIQ